MFSLVYRNGNKLADRLKAFSRIAMEKKLTNELDVFSRLPYYEQTSRKCQISSLAYRNGTKLAENVKCLVSFIVMGKK